MSKKTKSALLISGSLLAIAVSACWIYFQQFRTPVFNIALHRRIGEVMAEQTAKALGPKGRILVLTISTSGQPELEEQLNSFQKALKRFGSYTLKEHEVDTKDQPKYGVGAGISGRRFVRAVKNHPCDAVVSFIGAPKISDEECSQVSTNLVFIAETRSPDSLPKLFQKGLIRAAVVSRFTFPAPGPLKPSTPQEWFDKRYQIVTEFTNAPVETE